MAISTLSRQHAKDALDKVIKKSRVHLYKPIQVAEILYKNRTDNINLLSLSSYRTQSKKWRDDICMPLLGRVCSSSAKFQDNLFEDNAIPPAILNILGEENKRTNGAVEAYIYRHFIQKHSQLENALKYCNEASVDSFNIQNFIDSFWHEPGLRRSLDKIYEIIVYALFATVVDALDLKVEVSVNAEKLHLLSEFEDFAKKVMCLDFVHPSHTTDARVYRVGVTNAADRGLDMYSNWGPAIQIKHLTLDVELAHNIVTSISSDRIVIVCKDAERNVIISLLNQIGWGDRIQNVVTEKDLVDWYEKGLRGVYSDVIASRLLQTLREEISLEFPSVTSTPDILLQRHYEKIFDPFWT